MSVSFVQAVGSQPASGGASALLAYSSNTTKGSFLIAFAEINSTGATVDVSSITDTLGNTWTEIKTGIPAGGITFYSSTKQLPRAKGSEPVFSYTYKILMIEKIQALLEIIQLKDRVCQLEKRYELLEKRLIEYNKQVESSGRGDHKI